MRGALSFSQCLRLRLLFLSLLGAIGQAPERPRPPRLRLFFCLSLSASVAPEACSLRAARTPSSLEPGTLLLGSKCFDAFLLPYASATEKTGIHMVISSEMRPIGIFLRNHMLECA